MSAPIVFMDTETTGVHSRRLPWDVGMIRREPDGSQVEYQFYVEVDLRDADRFGLRVGKFYDRHPLGRDLARRRTYPGQWAEPVPQPNGRDYLTRGDAALAVVRMTHDTHVVGAVPSFDTDTLEPTLATHGLLSAWHYHLIDVEALAVGYLAAKFSPGSVSPPYKSDHLSDLLGVEKTPDDERHTAMGDARWVMRMYDAIMGGPS